MLVLLPLLLSLQEPLDLPGPLPRPQAGPPGIQAPAVPGPSPAAEPDRRPSSDAGPGPRTVSVGQQDSGPSKPGSGAGTQEPGPGPAPLGGPLVAEGPYGAGFEADDAPALVPDPGRNSPPPAVLARPAGDLLDRVLDRLGGLAAFEALGSLAVQRRIESFDARGRPLFDHRFWQWSRLDGTVPADEIQWREDLRFGQGEGRTWVRLDDLERPDLEASVRAELEAWGFLMRFPFCLRDRGRWLPQPEDRVSVDGRSWLRLRLVDRLAQGRACDLYLDPDSLVPQLLELRQEDRTRRIRLSQWVPVVEGGPRLPQRRTVLGEDGRTPSLEIHWEIARQRKWR